MADVLSTVWGLVKQTIGGNRNTWGGILNANMDILEAALSGVLSKAATGGAVTLTNTERRNRILSFSGTLTSDAVITIANLPAVWLVKNGTTGAFALSLKTPSGSAVALDQGGWSIVWCDGNDVINVGPASTMFSTQFKLPDGTLALPALSFLNETGLGVRRAGYAAGTLASNPYTTVNGQANVTVHHVAHGLAANDDAFHSGATAVNGITIDGLYNVTSVTDADNYVITHSAAATAGGTGGGTPNYKYMKAAATGGAIAVTKGGADIAHVSPYGVLVTGDIATTGAARIGNLFASGAATITGALSAAAATFTGLLTGAAATFSGLLTLSSTSHMIPPTGTTAQRPGTPAESNLRYNSDLHVLEWFDGTNWIQPQQARPAAGSYGTKAVDVVSNTTATVVLTDFVMSDGTNSFTENISVTLDLGSAGAVNKLDQGSITRGTYYYMWGVRKPDGTKGVVASKSSDGVNNGGLLLPTGFTAKGYIGTLHTVAGSDQLYGTKQRGKKVTYTVGAAQTLTSVVMDTGAKGSVTSPTWQGVTLAAFVPPNATAIRGAIGVYLSSVGSVGATVMAAPNGSYGAANSVSNPPPAIAGGFVSTSAMGSACDFNFLIEAGDIKWASSNSAGFISCDGWDEPI